MLSLLAVNVLPVLFYVIIEITLDEMKLHLEDILSFLSQNLTSIVSYEKE